MLYLRFGVKLQNMSETLKSTDAAVIDITHLCKLGKSPVNNFHYVHQVKNLCKGTI